MAMDVQDKRRIAQIFGSSTFAGNPLFFFDTSFLLASVASLAGWNQTRLEAAIAPRVEKQLNPADTRFTVSNGFYVVFGNGDICIAWDTAKAICDDIFRHFYGHGDYDPKDVGKFCRQSSAREAAADVGIELPSERESSPGSENGRASSSADLPESEKEKRLFRRGLVELFMDHFSPESQSGKFLFSPCWDSIKHRVTSFACESAADPINYPVVNPTPRGLTTAIAQCKFDVMALGVATRGVRHLLSRNDVAVVSAPVHVETLSWVKTRRAYIHVLAKIEPRYLMLLAPRITGLIAGSNPTSIAQWIAELRRYVRRSFVHLPNVDFDFSRDGVLGVTGFGFNVTSTIRASTAPLPALAAQAAKLKRICTNQSAIACVGNVDSAEELLLLKAHGIRVIGGSVIEEPSELPGPVRPLSFTELSPQPESETRQILMDRFNEGDRLFSESK